MFTLSKYLGCNDYEVLVATEDTMQIIYFIRVYIVVSTSSAKHNHLCAKKDSSLVNFFALHKIATQLQVVSKWN